MSQPSTRRRHSPKYPYEADEFACAATNSSQQPTRRSFFLFNFRVPEFLACPATNFPEFLCPGVSRPIACPGVSPPDFPSGVSQSSRVSPLHAGVSEFRRPGSSPLPLHRWSHETSQSHRRGERFVRDKARLIVVVVALNKCTSTPTTIDRRSEREEEQHHRRDCTDHIISPTRLHRRYQSQHGVPNSRSVARGFAYEASPRLRDCKVWLTDPESFRLPLDFVHMAPNRRATQNVSVPGKAQFLQAFMTLGGRL